MTKSIRNIGVSLALVSGVWALAQTPRVDIGARHGQLRAAQQNIVSAYQAIDRAQQNNDGQLGGHAQRAKDLLSQANEELRLAANVSNSEGR